MRSDQILSDLKTIIAMRVVHDATDMSDIVLQHTNFRSVTVEISGYVAIIAFQSRTSRTEVFKRLRDHAIGFSNLFERYQWYDRNGHLCCMLRRRDNTPHETVIVLFRASERGSTTRSDMRWHLFNPE